MMFKKDREDQERKMGSNIRKWKEAKLKFLQLFEIKVHEEVVVIELGDHSLW